MLRETVVNDECRFVHVQVRRCCATQIVRAERIWRTAAALLGRLGLSVLHVRLRKHFALFLIEFRRDFFCVDQFFVLIQEAFLQLVIGLWIC